MSHTTCQKLARLTTAELIALWREIALAFASATTEAEREALCDEADGLRRVVIARADCLVAARLAK